MNNADNESILAREWNEKQNLLADKAGLSILLVAGQQPPELAVSNNNSICQVVQASTTHAHRCQPFCGAAFDNAMRENKPIQYRCHAGLYCIATPLQTLKPLVAITGRTFLKTSDYRNLTERIFLGDWQGLPVKELIENVIMTGSIQDLEQLSQRLQSLEGEEKVLLERYINAAAGIELADDSVEEKSPNSNSSLNESEVEDILELEPAKDAVRTKTVNRFISETPEVAPDNSSQLMRIAETASQSSLKEQSKKINLFAQNLHKENYENAVDRVFEFLAQNFYLNQLAWLKNSNRALQFYAATGDWTYLPEQINLRADNEKLKTEFENQSSLKLVRKANNLNQTVEIFPLAVESEKINAAIVVGDAIENNSELKDRLTAFCRQIALSIEFIDLREEVEKRVRLQSAVRKFNAELEAVEKENYLEALVVNAAELVNAERCSLLIFDETEQSLQTAVAVGSHAEEIRNEKDSLGTRVARRVWREARPVLVADIKVTDFPAAPKEYEYQTDSFISLPLKIGGKNIGVLSITEKRGEEPFDKNDLLILETIAPQLAFALDRTVLSRKAGEYEIASITDGLTGLLNRRYLEERLAEELRRSARHGYPMSFMMIDVDNFKLYNDRFGHQAGDEALQITARCLRAALRSADVAARYGGEEFSILLPQTTLNEARLIAERIRRRVESTKFPHDQVTISIGIAAYSQQYDSPQAVIEAADRALYEAKNSGRNNVQLS